MQARLIMCCTPMGLVPTSNVLVLSNFSQQLNHLNEVKLTSKEVPQLYTKTFNILSKTSGHVCME